jgi:hypothetical protein
MRTGFQDSLLSDPVCPNPTAVSGGLLSLPDDEMPEVGAATMGDLDDARSRGYHGPNKSLQRHAALPAPAGEMSEDDAL